MTEDALAELAPELGVAAACQALGRPGPPTTATTASRLHQGRCTDRPPRPNPSPER